MLLADRASTSAEANGEEAVRLRAEVLAVFACNQLGRGASAGGRAVRALRAAQAVGAQMTERLVRVELAACATDASSPAVALSLLQQVLASRRRVAPTARAAAMVAAADALAKLGGGPEVPELLVAADGLYDASRAVEPDAVLLRRGVVHGRLAAHHRRTGDHRNAERVARAGLALLDELSDGQLETGQVSGALTLELVLALLDSARDAEAVLAAQTLLRKSVRPAGAPAACWLRLALAGRVHAPAGRYGLARRLVGDAAFLAERHQLDSLLAECHQLQSQLHEQCAELPDALVSLRAALFAERRWRSCTGELRTLLAAEFGTPPSAAQLRSELAAMVAGASALDQLAADRIEPAERELPVMPRRAVGDLQFGSVASGAAERPTPIRRRPLGRPMVADSGDAPRLASAPEPTEFTPPDLAGDPIGEAPGAALPPVTRIDAVDHSAVVPAPDQPAGSPSDVATQALAGAAEPVQAATVNAVPPVEPVDSASASTCDSPAVDAGNASIVETPTAGVGDLGELIAADSDGHVERPENASLAQPPSATEPTPTQAPTPTERPLRSQRMTPSPLTPSSPPTEPLPVAPPTAGYVPPTNYARASNGTGLPTSSGRHRSDAALADLLAEALLAYQDGRRSQAAAEPSNEHRIEPRTERPKEPPPAATRAQATNSPAPSQATTSPRNPRATHPPATYPPAASLPAASLPAASPLTARPSAASPLIDSPLTVSSLAESSSREGLPVAIPATRRQPIRSAPVPRLAPPSMSPPKPKPAVSATASQSTLSPQTLPQIPPQPLPYPDRISDQNPDRSQRDGEQQPEPDPTVTQPTRVRLAEVPTPPAKHRSMVDLPADQVWREPGTF